MSTLLVLFVGCVLHLGTVPSPGFAVVEVSAPVAEPGVDEAVRREVGHALGGQAAVGATPLRLTVERADWRPGRRTGDVVLYEATLAVRFRTEVAERLVTESTVVADPGSAAAAVPARAAAFAELAKRVAADGVAWLTLRGAPVAPTP